MPPKKGGKKGKKGQDDDDYWEQKAAAVDQKQAEIAQEDEGGGSEPRNAFDMLDDDSDDGGGLLSTISKSKDKKKEKKSKKKRAVAEEDEDEEVNAPEEVEATPVEETKPNLDDEWPEEDVKPKKVKKGKKGGKKAMADDDEDDWFVKSEDKVEEKKEAEEEAAPEKAAPTPPPEAAEPEDEDEGPKARNEESTILTKAQKEKLKKEKEKAKKKAQAAAKKGGAAPATTETPTASQTEPAADDAEEDDGDEDGAAGGDKKKKKKKKAAPKAPEPAPAKGKKVSAHILAMQAAMEEQKKAQEEAEKKEAERIRLIEEQEAAEAAEEQRIAEQKAAKKAKEKEKLAKAKAEGRALTPAQKREKAAAEARKQAMLAAGGLSVAGLQESGDKEKKKPVYSNKKKGGKAQKAEPSTPTSVASPNIEQTKSAPAPTPAAPAEDKEDDWDKSEEEDAAAVEQVVEGVDKLKVDDDEDDWDVSDEEPSKPAPAAKAETPASDAKDAPAPAQAVDAASSAKAAPKANGKPNGKPAPAEESSSEEDDSDDDDDDESDSDEDSSEEESEDEAEVRKAQALARIEARQQAAQNAKSKDDLRSPICCILGHVDTGKTKLLDKIRQTSVQEGEAGGITQQIGATFFPKEAIQEKTAVVNKNDYEVQIPGLLIIDTPGHESFSNLRTRGSSLCNIAILVVDLVHGLEPQTIESLNLLRKGKTPFIVALNKIDRMYGWKGTPNGGFRDTLANQDKSAQSEFEDRVKKTKLAFAEQGLNAELFDENKNLAKNVSLVPTSAITGEGIPDLLMLLVKLTQERMNQSLMFISELECTILEVKIVEGLGTTLDVILSNGVMREGDKIVLCGMDGPIVTQVRALLTPQPMRELRIKSAYVHHKEVKAALGVKISAPGLEKAIAGARLYVAQDDDEVEAYKDLAMQDVNDLQRFASKGPGVWVQASTLGSLEALLTFLKQMKIPVRNFAIGPVFRSHVLRAGRMLDVASEYALILAFDVPIDRDARDYADKEGIKIFSAMIIYHLFDAFTKYMSEVQEAKRQAAMPNAVWPVKLSIIRAFANRDPIVLGVDIIDGTLRTGTPVGIVRNDKDTGKREIVTLGKITSIEINHKNVDVVKRNQIGAGAAIKIERASYQSAKSYGRHFDDKDEIVSLISRQSIDTLKTTFREQVEMSDWALLKKMKVEQGIM